MNKLKNKVTVIILGTIHKYHYTIQSYNMEILKDVITLIKPDIICAELSDDQLFNRITCNSKPEYPEIIIPLAKRKGYKIYPIQPNTPQGMEWGAKRDYVMNDIKKTENKRNKFECYKQFSLIFDEIFLKCNDLKTYQSKILDLFFELEYEYKKQLFPSLGELRDKWNMYLYNNINDVIKKHACKNILVTVGISHKFWLNKKFSKRNDICLDYIENFLEF